jgi:hypothetical protein
MADVPPTYRLPDRPHGLSGWGARIGPAGLALLLALAALLLGLHGTDTAAQVYRVDELRLHGFVVWDSGWYGGSFPLSYSVLFPAVGAVIGLDAAAVLSAVAASWCFDRIVIRVVGRRSPGSWYFAAATLLAVSIGQLPYLAGEAVALAAILALLAGRTRVGVVLGMISALFSPLAAAFLILACGVWAVHGGRHRRPMVVTGIATGALVVALGAVFPGDGPFPFHWGGLVIVELLCLLVLSPLVPTTRTVRLAAGIYGLATLGSFIVPNPLGGNATRLAESIGVPLVACLMTMPAPDPDRVRSTPAPGRVLGALRRGGARLVGVVPHTWPDLYRPGTGRRALRRPAYALAFLLPFAVWQWSPGTGLVASSTPPSNTATFYRPLLHQLARLDGGRTVRVEVVPTLDHWESAYVAPYVSLARGWERQLDVQDNPIFYTPGLLDARSYRTWLDASGVSYVALPTAPLDYAATAEGALLRDHDVRGLQLVWHSATWRLWRVGGSPGLVTGPARLITMAPDRLVLDVARTSDVLVRVHYISFWHLDAGTACVLPAPGGWTEIHASRGRVELGAELWGRDPAACPSR